MKYIGQMKIGRLWSNYGQFSELPDAILLTEYAAGDTYEVRVLYNEKVVYPDAS